MVDLIEDEKYKNELEEHLKNQNKGHGDLCEAVRDLTINKNISETNEILYKRTQRFKSDLIEMIPELI